MPLPDFCSLDCCVDKMRLRTGTLCVLPGAPGKAGGMEIEVESDGIQHDGTKKKKGERKHFTPKKCSELNTLLHFCFTRFSDLFRVIKCHFSICVDFIGLCFLLLFINQLLRKTVVIGFKEKVVNQILASCAVIFKNILEMLLL